MPNKNSKIARRTAGKASSNIPVAKDDGTRWIILDKDDHQVYPGTGIVKAEAERLADGLLEPGRISQIHSS